MPAVPDMRAVTIAALAALLAATLLAHAAAEFEAFLEARPNETVGQIWIWKDVPSAELAMRQADASDLAACVVPSGTKAIVDREPGTWAWRVRVVEGPHQGCTGVVSSAYFKTARQREEARSRTQGDLKTPPKPFPDDSIRRVPPADLTAEQYFELGKEYKAAGWPEQARDALTRSIAADPHGIGKKAQIFLTGYLPRRRVSHAAAQKNIQGFNQMARGDLVAAVRTFQECIQQFPDFEWPYGNLGLIYTLQGRTKEAKVVLQRALAFNPSYVNGWVHLAEAHLRDGDSKSARYAANMALQLDPENPLAKNLLQRITA